MRGCKVHSVSETRGTRDPALPDHPNQHTQLILNHLNNVNPIMVQSRRNYVEVDVE